MIVVSVLTPLHHVGVHINRGSVEEVSDEGTYGRRQFQHGFESIFNDAFGVFHQFENENFKVKATSRISMKWMSKSEDANLAYILFGEERPSFGVMKVMEKPWWIPRHLANLDDPFPLPKRWPHVAFGTPFFPLTICPSKSFTFLKKFPERSKGCNGVLAFLKCGSTYHLHRYSIVIHLMNPLLNHLITRVSSMGNLLQFSLLHMDFMGYVMDDHVTTAVYVDHGTNNLMKGNSQALATTVIAIFNATSSVGATLGYHSGRQDLLWLH
eukprot:Gb_04903 [translate_table: standard]